MFRGLRPPRWFVQRDLHALVRSFPSERIKIIRPVLRVSGMETEADTETVVFEGEALFIPAGGDVKRFGLGQVEEDQPQMLVPGRFAVQQGDLVYHVVHHPTGKTDPVRRYLVKYQPNHWEAFLVLTLTNYEQGDL